MIEKNFQDIQKRIAGRAQLIAVSKNQSSEKIEEALKTGHRLFGENRVQEAKSHWQELRKTYPDLKLHLIGPLQTNKARDAVALFDVIETIDRENLVDEIAKESKKQNRHPDCFIQVNTGDEAQKAGVSLENFAGLLAYALEKGLKIKGLMCIPPVAADPAPHFALLKNLAAKNNLPELSMGMSGDFEIAIEEGATFVRVGTALFGER